MGHLRCALVGLVVGSMACTVSDGLPVFVALDTPSVAVMVVTPRVIEFGAAGRGGPRYATLVVENSGGEALTLVALTVVGSEVFSLVDTPALPLSIMPNEAVALEMACAPGGWGEVADLVVVSSDPLASEQVVTLYGGRPALPFEP